MKSSTVAPINSSFVTPSKNTDHKVSSLVSTATELATIITMWGVVSTVVILLSFTWV